MTSLARYDYLERLNARHTAAFTRKLKQTTMQTPKPVRDLVAGELVARNGFNQRSNIK